MERSNFDRLLGFLRLSPLAGRQDNVDLMDLLSLYLTDFDNPPSPLPELEGWTYSASINAWVKDGEFPAGLYTASDGIHLINVEDITIGGSTKAYATFVDFS